MGDPSLLSEAICKPRRKGSDECASRPSKVLCLSRMHRVDAHKQVRPHRINLPTSKYENSQLLSLLVTA